MISEFTDRQATNADLYELEDVETGQKRQYRIVSKATVTVPGTDLNKATLDPILEEIAGKLSANGGTMSGNIVPNSTGTRNLGSSSLRWKYVYGNIGNFKEQVAINGNAIVDSSYSSTTNKGYVKFYDGTMICYGKQTWTNVDVTKAWGSMYESTTLMTFSNFSATFSAVPVAIAFPNPSGRTDFMEGYYNISTTGPGSFYVCLPGTNSNMTAGASYIAIGRWK